MTNLESATPDPQASGCGQGATWLANPLHTLAIKALGTAVSATFSDDLREPSAGRIHGRPVVASDDAPPTETTTALDSEMLFGDFSAGSGVVNSNAYVLLVDNASA